MATEDDGATFTIGPPGDPIPVGALHDHRSLGMDKGAAFDEVDYQSHRNVIVAVHIPYTHHKKHRHKKHRHHHHKKQQNSAGGSAGDNQNNDELLQEPKSPVDPCDRVKFILEGEGEGEGEGGGGGAGGGGAGARRESHSVFTELEELRCHHNKVEWKETARWVKFEEDVEEGGNKWSKPHVATLSLHSLFELRKCILKGTVLFDLEANDLGQIADYVLDSLVATKQLEEDKREKVRAALLLRHKHQNSRDHENKLLSNIRSMAEIGRIGSSGSGNKHMDHQDSVDGAQPGGGGGGGGQNFLTPYNHPHTFPVSAPHLGPSGGSTSSNLPSFGRKLSSASNYSSGAGAGTEELGNGNGDSTDNFKPPKPDSHFMKKIPPGSEASNVLVGEVEFLDHAIIAFVRLKEAVLLGDITEIPIPTRFLFIMLGPKGNRERYHEVGRSIATLMSDEVFHEVAYKARKREDLLAGVDEFLDKVTVLPPGEWDPTIRLEPPPEVPSQAERLQSKPALEPEQHGEDDSKSSLVCSKIPFHGLIQDVKRRYPKYWSDIRDAFSLQVLASIIFIFFANITPAVTFGGVLGGITNGELGALEMIAAVSFGNIIYSVTAGQPLVVLGGTGPTLIFEDIVYKFSQQNDIPYLNFRFWIGMWTAILIIVVVAVNASVMMRLFTRFTEEIFSALISFIFIYEALDKVWKVHLDYSYNEWILQPTIQRDCDCFQFSSNESLAANDLTNATKVTYFWDNPNVNCSEELDRKFVGKNCNGLHPDVFLMSVILFFGTFLLSFYLKRFRGSSFFSLIVRHIISDFAVFLAVIVWVAIDILAGIDTPKLIVPDIFSSGFYSSDRGFIINPLGNGLPSWAPFMAMPFAILATILLFMDQQITALIVNRKDHKLKKGSGYHLDMCIVGVLIFVHSVLGLPWVVGATVRSITHVQSLFILSPCTAPGERPKFMGVREQRVTLFLMALLIGISMMLYHVLSLLPLPVLYGIFLYIGVASLYGVQFVQRLALPFIPDKYKPDYHYLRRIPNLRIHAYTLYQVVFFLILCVFKVVQQLSIVFPIMVLMLVGARWLAGFLFRWSDLELLDDSISPSLYCGKVRDRKRRSSSSDLEEGGGGGGDKTVEGDVKSNDAGANGTTKTVQSPLEKRKSGINMTQAVDSSGIWKNMMRKLEAPLQSPHRRARFKPTPLDPIIREEESDLLSPRSTTTTASAAAAVTDVVIEITNPATRSPDSDVVDYQEEPRKGGRERGEGGEAEEKEEEEGERDKRETLSATNSAAFQVTSV